MQFSDAITRMPRPYQPEVGADVAELFSGHPKSFVELVEGTAGCSPYLAGLLQREHQWIAGLQDHSAESLRDEALAGITNSEPAKLADTLRQAKRRLALLVGLADLGGVWSLEQVTQALTDLADAAVDHGLKALVAAEIARGKLPGLSEDDVETAGGMSVLAMGKMGAGELNYSSDIDLICLFDESRFEPDEYMEARTAFVRVTRRLMAMLSDLTAEGYVFRTDLRLRPDPSVTPVCIAMEAAERYYESVGRTWERAAFIKARPCAGDIKAGEAFLNRLTPFIWRKHLDFAAIQDAHDMRLRIRDHKKLGGKLSLAGHDMKLGKGGIREIEFFTQTFQIIAGGRDPDLRVRGTIDGLDKLAHAGWVEPDDATQLQKNYRAHREVEHRLQMIGDAQTHALPTTVEGFDRLAAFMGQEPHEVETALTERLTQTSKLTEAFFVPDTPDAEPVRPEVAELLERWRGYPALRSERAVEIFNRLFPDILARLDAAARPDEALGEFERFLAGLPAGVQVFSLFESNPQLTDLIIDICTASPVLADYLARNAQVLDAVIGGAFFAEWPEEQGLLNDLATRLRQLDDYEAQLNLARRWQKEWHFRIGVHQLHDLITPEQAAAQYADLAAAVVQAIFPEVQTAFGQKHGEAPGQGAAVLAMGSLGAGRLSATSDLDLIVIYNADGADSSEGPRPLTTRLYFARLTQALVTALSAPTSEGKLYEVDMRLRPSGQAGPVATSIQAFESYQRDEAWLWEHMALTRARAMAGDGQLLSHIDEVRDTVLKRPRAKTDVAEGTQEMRQRLQDAGRHGGAWHVKEGAGGSQDIELFGQALALQAGTTMRDTGGQLRAGAVAGLLSEADSKTLAGIHKTFGRVTQVARLLTGQVLDPDALGSGGREIVLKALEADTIAALDVQLEQCRKQAKEVIETALAGMLGDAKTADKTN